MTYCPSRERRSTMTDSEFWEDVYPSMAVDDDPDYDTIADTKPIGFTYNAPCPECGEFGPCGFDAIGRPMVHIMQEEFFKIIDG